LVPPRSTPMRIMRAGRAASSAALAAPGCAGWSVCIYNPDLDAGLDGADAIIGYLAQAITGDATT